MKQTTLCYLERDGQYLMLHRVKKEHDENHDKWIGVGGKFEDRESPEDCVRREVLEETGLTLTQYRYCGLVTFVSDIWPTEYMHLFHATGFTGTPKDCDEGELAWIGQAEARRPAAVGGRPDLPAAHGRARAVFLAEAGLRGRYAHGSRSERKAAGTVLRYQVFPGVCSSCFHTGYSVPVSSKKRFRSRFSAQASVKLPQGSLWKNIFGRNC